MRAVRAYSRTLRERGRISEKSHLDTHASEDDRSNVAGHVPQAAASHARRTSHCLGLAALARSQGSRLLPRLHLLEDRRNVARPSQQSELEQGCASLLLVHSSQNHHLLISDIFFLKIKLLNVYINRAKDSKDANVQ